MAGGRGCGVITNSLICIYDQLSFIYRQELVIVVMTVDKRAGHDAARTLLSTSMTTSLVYSHACRWPTLSTCGVMTNSLLSTVMTVTINSLIYIPWPTLLSTVMHVDDQLLERCSVMQIRELLRHVNKGSCVWLLIYMTLHSYLQSWLSWPTHKCK